MTAPLPAHVIIVSIRDFFRSNTAVTITLLWHDFSCCCTDRRQDVLSRARHHYAVLVGRVTRALQVNHVGIARRLSE
jgi:hypothetical protein